MALIVDPTPELIWQTPVLRHTTTSTDFGWQLAVALLPDGKLVAKKVDSQGGQITAPVTLKDGGIADIQIILSYDAAVPVWYVSYIGTDGTGYRLRVTDSNGN